MSAPEIIIISLTYMSLGISLARDGEPRTGKYSFALSFFSQIIMLLLLFWAGLFH